MPIPLPVVLLAREAAPSIVCGLFLRRPLGDGDDTVESVVLPAQLIMLSAGSACVSEVIGVVLIIAGAFASIFVAFLHQRFPHGANATL